LIAAMAAGLLIAWVDSLPAWDDAGITASALFLGAGIIGLFVRRWPWLFGLAVGLWIPLRGIILRHDARFLLALLFPLAGVYAGWGIRRLVRGRSAAF
jgi:hypothetical protein